VRSTERRKRKKKSPCRSWKRLSLDGLVFTHNDTTYRNEGKGRRRDSKLKKGIVSSPFPSELRNVETLQLDTWGVGNRKKKGRLRFTEISSAIFFFLRRARGGQKGGAKPGFGLGNDGIKSRTIKGNKGKKKGVGAQRTGTPKLSSLGIITEKKVEKEINRSDKQLVPRGYDGIQGASGEKAGGLTWV